MDEATQDQDPEVWRVVLGFVLCPGVAALTLAIMAPGFDGVEDSFERAWRTAVFYGLFGAYPSALIVGLPTMAFLYGRVRPSWLSCSLAGAFVAGVPWALIVMLYTADEASVGGRATVIDGTTTAYGWWLNALSVGQIALLGAGAGLLFWAIVTRGGKANQRS